ncbi:MAG: hypothetical protein R3Y64_08000 [Peptostreptococcaceae bacterium]
MTGTSSDSEKLHNHTGGKNRRDLLSKPMKDHNLMQEIARVNRVFKYKAGGIVIDYIVILENLKSSLKQYTDSDKKTTGIDLLKAIAIMNEKLEVLRDIMYQHKLFEIF